MKKDLKKITDYLDTLTPQEQELAKNYLDSLQGTQEVQGKELATNLQTAKDATKDTKNHGNNPNNVENQIEQTLKNNLHALLSRRYWRNSSTTMFMDKNLSEVENILSEGEVPIDIENSILHLDIDTEIAEDPRFSRYIHTKPHIVSCTIEKASGERKKGVIVNTILDLYSSPRKLIFDQNGVYIEIVPIGKARSSSYAGRASGILEFGGMHSAAVTMEDGCGIYIKSKDFFPIMEELLENTKDMYAKIKNEEDVEIYAKKIEETVETEILLRIEKSLNREEDLRWYNRKVIRKS